MILTITFSCTVCTYKPKRTKEMLSTGIEVTKHCFSQEFRRLYENSEKFVDFRRNNSKAVTNLRKIKCKPNFTAKILCIDIP